VAVFASGWAGIHFAGKPFLLSTKYQLSNHKQLPIFIFINSNWNLWFGIYSRFGFCSVDFLISAL